MEPTSSQRPKFVGVTLNGLWPLTQSRALHEYSLSAGGCILGCSQALSVLALPSKDGANSDQALLYNNDIRRAQAKCREQLSSPTAWWVQEELQV